MTVLTDLIKVEGKFSGNRAVEASLDEGRPLMPELVRTASVLRADACNSREDSLAAVDVLDGCLSEEEVHVFVLVHRVDEVWRIQVLRIELLRPKRRSIDQRVCARELGHRRHVQVVLCHGSRVMTMVAEKQGERESANEPASANASGERMNGASGVKR